MTESSIGCNDVLCGRGGATNNHVGNKRFRKIVAEYQHEYLEARKKEKAVIARSIVARIKGDGGRFLKRDGGSGMWIQVTDKKATEKTSQALREGLDVRHGTIRPEKMPRRDSNSHENPRKRTRLVEGKVQSPTLTSFHVEAGVPELNEELMQPAMIDPMFAYFQPPRISRADCRDVAEV